MAHEDPQPRAGRRAAVLGTRRLVGAGSLGDLFSSASDALASLFRVEADAARLAPWLPVAFGIGILLYFAAPAEPSLIAAVGALAFFALATWLSREHASAFVIALGLAFLAAGFAASTLRAAWVAAGGGDTGRVIFSVISSARTRSGAREAAALCTPWTKL